MTRHSLILAVCVAAAVASTNAADRPSWIHKVTITIGSELAANGAIVDEKETTVVSPGDVVYISMDVAAAPDKSSIKVVWMRPDGSTITEETKPTTAGKKYLTFSSGDTKAWAKGKYKVDFWFDGHNVGSATIEFS